MKRVSRMGLAAGLAICGGCAMHLDRATEIGPGDARTPVYSVDGGVHVASHARAGKIRSVDGGVALDDFAAASAIEAVDGTVSLGRQAVCAGDLSSVDGRVRLGRGARVEGDLRTYAAGVEADDAQIDGAVRTVAGRIALRGITHVGKGIYLDRPKPSTDPGDEVWKRLPVVVIGPGVVVDGPIVAQRGGTLRVSRQAKIGRVEGIEPQWFDGSAPADATP